MDVHVAVFFDLKVQYLPVCVVFYTLIEYD